MNFSKLLIISDDLKNKDLENEKKALFMTPEKSIVGPEKKWKVARTLHCFQLLQKELYHLLVHLLNQLLPNANLQFHTVISLSQKLESPFNASS